MQFISRLLHAKILARLLLLGITLVVIIYHLWMIGSIPKGLYVDESSIGLNAAAISTTLHDEHGISLPVYFKAFGEYKNPLYIYSASILFKVLGISETTLRLTSFMYFVLFLFGLAFVVRQLFPQNKLVLGYSVLAGGFLPWLFNLSRISFEVISQPAIMIWAIYFVIRTYATEINQSLSRRLAITSGLLIGLSIYTYSTSRILSFAFLISLLICYRQRQYWYRHLMLVAGTSLALIPYLYFSFTHPGALTSRFNLITYINNAQLSLFDKITIFFTNYFSYFEPDFLLFHGDLNLRHHTGFAGEIYFSIYILFIVGVTALIFKSRHFIRDKKIALLISCNLIITPIAAALTEPNHSLRSIMLGAYILILSCFGLTALQSIRLHYLRYISIITIAILLLVEVSLYIQNYFDMYAVQSIYAFESYDIKQDLKRAIEFNPRDIIISSQANQPYAHLDFYKYQLNTDIPMYVAYPEPAPHRCIIIFYGSPPMKDLAGTKIVYEEHSLYSRLTCYQ